MSDINWLQKIDEVLDRTFLIPPKDVSDSDSEDERSQYDIEANNTLSRPDESNILLESESIESEDISIESNNDIFGICNHPISWNESPNFDRRLNCLGIVYIRMRSLKYLPCSENSAIHVILSLKPWKGHIKTKKVYTQTGRSGTKIEWTKKTSQFLHAYNNDETPTPSIHMDFIVTTMQIIESSICSFCIPVQPLMSYPGLWHRSSFSAEYEDTEKWKEKVIFGKERKKPLLSVDLCFQPFQNEKLDIKNNKEKNPNHDLPRSIMAPTTQDDIHHLNEENDPTLTVTELNNSQQTILNESIPTSSSSIESNIKQTSQTPHLKNQEIDTQSILSINTMSYLSTTTNTNKKLHLFRRKTFWSPAYCLLCKSFITSGVLWGKQGYQCEHDDCHLPVCEDCQLQANIRYPCGSQKVKQLVSKSIRKRIQNADIMNIVAPTVSPSSSSQPSQYDIESYPNSSNPSNNSIVPSLTSLGKLRIHVSNACLFERTYPSETNIEFLTSKNETKWLRQGNYYVRIRIIQDPKNNNHSIRTPTVYQTSKPNFEQDLEPIIVSHYGMEIRIDVIDAVTDKPVGICFLSIQSILQRQRDWFAIQDKIDKHLLFDPRQKINCNDECYTLELRTGLKNGSGLEFLNQSDGISGWIRVFVRLEENERLYSLVNPIQCPSRPPEKFNVELIQLYIARISQIVKDITSLIGTIQYLISWEDPALTGLIMIFFVFTCVYFNAEYIASLPLFLLLIWMIVLGIRRRSGDYKMKWVIKERDKRIDAEKKLAISYSIHRPCAKVKATITKGRNLRSRELGLPGSLYVSVSYDPLRLLHGDTKKTIANLDNASSLPHDMGMTGISNISMNPIWNKIIESDQSSRLKHLLSQSQFFQKDEIQSNEKKNTTFTFPILQSLGVGIDENNNFVYPKSKTTSTYALVPWDSCPGAMVFQVRFDQLFNKLHVFDDILGEVSIPISKIMKSSNNELNYYRIEGWFQVQEIGTLHSIQLKDNHQNSAEINPEKDKTDFPNKESFNDLPAIFICIEIQIPDDKSHTSDISKEASIVVAEEMIRNISLAQDSKVGVIGNSINTFNTVRGLGGNLQDIQNLLGNIVDKLEILRNVFNWTSPQITMVVFVATFSLWLVLYLIPGRIIILVSGLYVFIDNFIKKVWTEENVIHIKNLENQKPQPFPIVCNNILQSIPNDEDLRRIYFWESLRVGEKERKKYAQTKRISRLRVLWSAHWFGEMKIKVNRESNNTNKKYFWDPIFAVVHGHRIVWWSSEKSFDDGKAPIGSIVFAGHSGLAGFSPLELREFDKTEIAFMVNIFGRGDIDQQKISLLLPDKESKSLIENAVLQATTDTKRD